MGGYVGAHLHWVGKGLIPGAPLLFIMRLSQVAQGVVLPIFLFFLIRLASSERVMGTRANARWLNAVSWTGAMILGLMSLYRLISPLAAREH